jgi:hypothetical protein
MKDYYLQRLQLISVLKNKLQLHTSLAGDITATKEKIYFKYILPLSIVVRCSPCQYTRQTPRSLRWAKGHPTKPRSPGPQTTEKWITKHKVNYEKLHLTFMIRGCKTHSISHITCNGQTYNLVGEGDHINWASIHKASAHCSAHSTYA